MLFKRAEVLKNIFQSIKKLKDKPQTGKKTFTDYSPIKGLYLEYMRDSHNSKRKKKKHT